MNITREDAIFFMDGIDSVYSPHFKPRNGKKRSFEKWVKETDKEEYKRFISVYKEIRHILNEKQQFVLDRRYGLEEMPMSYSKIASLLGVTKSTIAQHQNRAENILSQKLWLEFKTKEISPYVEIKISKKFEKKESL